MTAPLYTRDILRLASAIPHLGTLAEPDGRAERRAPICGSKVSVDVAMDPPGRVGALGLTIAACAFGQASAALMSGAAIGRSRTELATALAALERWLDGSSEDSRFWPGIEALAPARSRHARHGAILLPFQALLAAVEDADQRAASEAR